MSFLRNTPFLSNHSPQTSLREDDLRRSKSSIDVMSMDLRLMLSSRGMSSEVKADFEGSSEKMVNSSVVVMESEKM